MTDIKHRRQEAGLTLIEVLVAILIFSFGLLGFVGLQARAIQFSVASEDSNRAALLANEMAATMLTTNTVDTSSTALTAAISSWQDRARDARGVGLPNGTASAVSNSASQATLAITWRSTAASAGAANATNQYITQVLLP